MENHIPQNEQQQQTPEGGTSTTPNDWWEPPCLGCYAPMGYKTKMNYYLATHCLACRSESLSDRLSASGLPVDFSDRSESLHTFEAKYADTPSGRKALMAANKFVSELGAKLERPCIYFGGPKGVGKTHLAAGIVSAAIANGMKARFRVWGRIMDEIVASYGEHSTDDVVDFLCKVPLLAIDDVGAEKISESAVGKLYSILNERMNQRRATVLTSMHSQGAQLGSLLSRTAVDDKVVGAILDRLRGFAVIIQMSGESTRSRA